MMPTTLYPPSLHLFILIIITCFLFSVYHPHSFLIAATYSDSVPLIPFTPSPVLNLLIQEAEQLEEATEYQQAMAKWEEIANEYKKNKQYNDYIAALVNQTRIAFSFDRQLALSYANKGLALVKDYHPYVADSTIGKLYQRKGEALFFLNQLDSALVNTEKAILLYEKGHFCLGALYVTLTQSVLYHRLEEMALKKACLLGLLNKVLNCRELSTEDSLYVLISAHNSLSVVYNAEGNYNQWFAQLEQVQALMRKSSAPDEKILGSIYNNLGVAYHEKGDYAMSENYYKKALIYKRKAYGNDIKLLPTISNQSHLLIDRRAYTSVLKEIVPTVDAISYQELKTPKQKSDLRRIYVGIIKAYVHTEQYDTAQYYLEQLHHMCLGSEINIHDLYAGYLAYHQQNYPKAVRFLQEYEQQKLNKYHPHHHQLTRTYHLLGDSWLAQQEWEKSLAYYQRALSTLSPSFRDSATLTNPHLAEVSSKPDLLKILQKKAQALHQLYKAEPQQLTQALSTSEFACEVIDAMRRSYQLADAKHFLATQAHAIYEQAIETALTLYEQTKEPIYQQKAFYFSERGKATILLEQMQEANAKQLATNVPDSLLQLETRLQQDRWFYHKKIMEEERKEAANQDSLKLATWHQLVWTAEQNLNELKQKLETAYDNYHVLKYDVHYAEPEQIQQILASLNQTYQQDHVVMSYFMGEEHTYLFALTPANIHTYRIANSGALRKMLIQLYDNLKNADMGLQDYPTLAHQSYQQLVEPMAHLLADNSTLIVIPDGQLSYIPFEALLTKASTSKNPRDFPYLFSQHPISYAYSATLWAQQMQMQEERGEKATKDFIGFAPSFKGEDAELIAEVRSCGGATLSPLLYNMEEVKTIQNIVGGTAYLNVSATIDNFLTAAPAYKMIHIATHACVHDEQAMFNAIHLKDGALSTYELFNLSLKQTELVTLSACQTGTGELSKGEGVISLSRAFTQGGCPSLIHSLWNANDWTASYLMERLYIYLKEGLPKPVALQKAKLDYLNNEKFPRTLQHPFYWSNFIHSGKVTPVQLSNPYSFSSILWWLLGGLGLGLVVTLVWVKSEYKT